MNLLKSNLQSAEKGRRYNGYEFVSSNVNEHLKSHLPTKNNWKVLWEGWFTVMSRWTPRAPRARLADKISADWLSLTPTGTCSDTPL